MGFEDLWEKYGEKREKEMPSDVCAEKKTQVFRNTSQTANVTKNEAIKYKPAEPKMKTQEKKQTVDRAKHTSVGVFGDERDVTVGKPPRHRIKNTNHLSISGIKDWPWLDIVFIIITLLMVVKVIADFEKVTTALFNILLPLLCNTLSFIIVLILIAALVWWIAWIFRRPQRRRW